MICGMTYYQICWYFLIYSFGGWALEVVYHAVACGKVINRGFLNGPVCPVYGFGVLSVFAMMNTFQGSGYQLNDGMIFLFGVILLGLNRKLTRLDTIRANMRVISDKISDSLATTTIDTVQKVGEGKVQAALARAEFKEATEEKVNKSIETLRKNKADLQKEFDELSSSIVEHTFVGQGRLIKAFPDMKHRDYLELVQELKSKIKDRK